MKQHKDEDSMEEQVLKIVKNDHEARICLLEKSVSNIEQILIIIQKDMKDGFNKIEQKFEKMEQKFEQMEQKIDSNFKWLIENSIKNLDKRIWMVFVFMVGGFGGILFALAQSLHWFK